MNVRIPPRSAPRRPAGEDKSGWLAVLEQGANVLQRTSPMSGFDVYVVGLHCAKNRPDMQMEAHHYCGHLNEELIQCVIFDGNEESARIMGVEYIIGSK